MIKVEKDIESLLVWAYLHELPKRQISSAEGLWDGIREYGQRGGIDVGHSAAQRYPHFGLPHDDAILIEKAVGQLGGVVIDWKIEFDAIAFGLSALVSINDFAPREREPISRAAVAGARDGRGISAVVVKARDVILVNTINTQALVIAHAIKGTRPDWRTEQMRAVPTIAERSKLSKVIGKCKGKNHYAAGSYCPLRWEPSPFEVVLQRADYRIWHRALCHLARTLRLADHTALPPAASALPWIEGEIRRAIFTQPHDCSKPLLLKPARKRAGPPPEKPKRSKGCRIKIDGAACLT